MDNFVEKLDSVLKNLTNELNAIDFNSSDLESYKITITQSRDGEKSIDVQLTPVEVSND